MFIARWLKAASFLLVVGAMAFGIDSAGQDPAPASRRSPGKTEAGRRGRPRVDRQEPAHDDDAPDDAGDLKIVNGVQVIRAKPDTLTVSVTRRGTVESANVQDVFSQSKAARRSSSIVPEGTRVKKGDVVCELDSSNLRDRSSIGVSRCRGPGPPSRTPAAPAKWPRSPLPSTRTASTSMSFRRSWEKIRLAESAMRNARGPAGTDPPGPRPIEGCDRPQG